MMGRSLEYSLVLNIFLRNHSSFVMRDLMHPPILMKHIHGHGSVSKDDVSIITDMVELIG
jgi:hypothetical protein